MKTYLREIIHNGFHHIMIEKLLSSQAALKIILENQDRIISIRFQAFDNKDELVISVIDESDASKEMVQKIDLASPATIDFLVWENGEWIDSDTKVVEKLTIQDVVDEYSS